MKAICALLAAFLVPVVATAGTKNGNFNVQLNVLNPASACNQAFAATNIDFGTITTTFQGSNLVVPAQQAVGQITVNCAPGLAYAVSLSAGTGGVQSADYARTMRQGSFALTYAIFVPSASNTCSNQSAFWGDGTSGTAVQNGIGTGLTQTIATCAFLPLQNSPGSGVYTDQVTATVTF